jgi:thiamine transport system ATP-binding protein
VSSAPSDVAVVTRPPAGLELEGVVVVHGALRAVDGIDLAVADGEVVALLGPSGSGKTTLLRAVAGFEPLQAGRVLVRGTDLAGVPPHRRGVGLMFQDHALFPHRDVGSNVAFGLRMRGDDRAAVVARVGEMLDLVGLGGFERRPVDSLSGGEQQRVALARALAPAPDVLLLDEPLGSLDRALRERLVAEIRRLLVDLRITSVFVTHDQGEAFAVADRVATLAAGRLASLVRTDAVRLGMGEHRGLVEAIARHGDVADVTVSLDGGGLVHARVAPADAPKVGETVRVALDPP